MSFEAKSFDKPKVHFVDNRLIQVTTPITFDCTNVDNKMQNWLSINNPTPPKPIHMNAGSRTSGRVFFNSKDVEKAIDFLFLYHLQIGVTNLNSFTDVTIFNEPLVVWMRRGKMELKNQEEGVDRGV